MELAALLIAVAALVLATVSVTLQVTLYVLKQKEPKVEEAPRYMVTEDFLTPSDNEMTLRPVKGQAQQDDKRLQEAFDNPDTPYTGIDEEFNV